MKRKKAPLALKVVGVVVGLLVVIVLFLGFTDWNFLRQPIVNFAGKRIDRTVELDGLHVRLFSRTPRIQLTGLRVGNPPWAGGGHMVNVDSMTVDLKGAPLLIGNLVVLRVEIDKPWLSLIRTTQDRANWQFGALKKGKTQRDVQPMDLPVIRELHLRGGRIEVRDEFRKLHFDGTVEAGEDIKRKEEYAFNLRGKGELNKRAFDLRVKGGPLLNVERSRPYPFDADIKAGTTNIEARGAITEPFNLGKLQVDLHAAGEDLANLYYFSGLALPNTPPYDVKAHLRREGTRFFVDDFSGKIGDSEVGQSRLTIETAGERPKLTGELVATSLDLDDLGASVGAAPQADETISPRQRRQGQVMARQGRLFPDAKLQVERVRAMDADVTFRAQTVKTRKIPMREVAFHLTLDDGVLKLDPLSFVLPQGKFAGAVRIDARPKTPKVSADFRVTGVQLGQFKPKDAPAPLEGPLLGRVKFDGQGDSVLAVVSSANGSVTAIVPRGEIREAFAELTGINVARGLGLLLTKDQKQVAVRCGVADFQLQDGKLAARNLVFDTENVLITGKGDIDLDSETLDLSIKGQPKKLRLLRVRAPIAVKGPLRKPKIGIEGEDTAKQTGIAAVLAAVAAPLAAVVAFVDPGLAKDADCSALLAEAQSKGTPEPTAAAGK